MSVTTVVKLIGSGQVYTTLATWEAGAPSDLTTAEKSAAGTFLVAAFVQGESLTFVGSGATGKFLDTDSTGAGNGTYVTYGVSSGNPAALDVVTGGTSGATCVLSSGTPANTGIVWQGQINSASDVFTSVEITVAGDGTSSTCYKHLTAKAGASFVDNANAQTNALRYNTANGCAITGAPYLSSVVRVSSQYFALTRIQLACTSGVSFAFNSDSSSPVISSIDQCIIEGGKSGQGPCSTPFITNSLVVARYASNYICALTFGAQAHNCTFVVPSDLPKVAVGIGTYGAASVVKNCAIFGVNDAPSSGATFTSCCSDDASPPSGVTTLAYDTSTGSGFQNTLDATRDFRIKSSSGMLDVGTADPTYAAVDIVGTARPQGSAYDVGCWELVVSSGVTGTVASTDRRDTSSASGIVKVTGTAASTDRRDTSSASGVVGNNVTGTVSSTDRRDSSTATGTIKVTGSVASIDVRDTSSAAGIVKVTGSAASTDIRDIGSASGLIKVTGTVASTDARDSCSATGLIKVTGTVSSTDGRDTSSAAGTVTITGSVASTDTRDTSSAAGVVKVTGSAATTDGRDVGLGTGTVVTSVTGSGAAIDRRDVGLGVGTVEILGVLCAHLSTIEAYSATVSSDAICTVALADTAINVATLNSEGC